MRSHWRFPDTNINESIPQWLKPNMRGIVFLEFPAVSHFTVLYITNALLFSPKTTNFIQFTKLPNALTKTTYKTLDFPLITLFIRN